MTRRLRRWLAPTLGPVVVDIVLGLLVLAVVAAPLIIRARWGTGEPLVPARVGAEPGRRDRSSGPCDGGLDLTDADIDVVIARILGDRPAGRD